jgi:hypothetical protein
LPGLHAVQAKRLESKQACANDLAPEEGWTQVQGLTNNIVTLVRAETRPLKRGGRSWIDGS